MAGPSPSDVTFEIGHVLFIDIVGYSKLMIHEQAEQLERLREIVRATEPFQTAQADGKLLRLPSGDGGALVFYTTPEAPVRCAVEVSKALRKHPDLKARIGIHSGPIKEVTDLNEQANIAGAGINIAQRVMDCGDAGHLLLSKRVADDLEQYARWRPLLHDLGTCEVKHGTKLALVNLYSEEFGNPEPPQKLKSLTPAEEPSPPKRVPLGKSIAVLPFENLSEDKANAYFADGIQEELLSRLSTINQLKVISRTSTLRFKGVTENLPEIARQLGVANIVEGSVRKSGDRVRVHVQLIDAETDAHLWAERYDRTLTDIFEVETDIASKIADALKAELTGAERRAISTQPTKNREAHEFYLRGKHLWRNFLAPGYERVRESFEKAIELDPSYAAAYAGLSLYHSFGAANGVLHPEHWPLAEKAVNRALELDELLPEAYNPLAAVEVYYKRNWTAAERAFKRGAELSPNLSDVRHHYGLCLVLHGRPEEGIAVMDHATELDPFFPGLHLHAGRVFFFMRDYDAAIKRYIKTLELQPGSPAAHEYFGDACAQNGMTHEAITQWAAALRFTGRAPLADLLEQTFASSGFDAAVRALGERQLEKLKTESAAGRFFPAWDYVSAYLRTGDTEQALAWLPKVVEERSWFALQLKLNPVLDPIRQDPRFQRAIASLPN
ncbi:MAG: adenylate/guanylate cyclase domain-containing protein [Chthoniobacterales bacterium]